jgi:hypothetical protein
MPFNVAAATRRATTAPAVRLIDQTYYEAIRVDQSHLEPRVVLDRILAAWFDEAVLYSRSARGRRTDRRLAPSVVLDGHEHVDPSKEATAQGTRLANHTTTLADEYARQQASDWETRVPPAQKRSP